MACRDCFATAPADLPAAPERPMVRSATATGNMSVTGPPFEHAIDLKSPDRGQSWPRPVLGLGWAAVALVVFAVTWSVLLLDDDHIKSLAREDGPIESLGAVAWFLSAMICLRVFVTSPVGVDLGLFRWRKNLFLLLLAMLFLFGAGEEISWGQRIIGFETPEVVKEYNRQNEFNIHNLAPFYQTRPLLISINQLFTLFWMGFCVALPLLVWMSAWVRRLVGLMGVPVVPLGLSFLFLLNYGFHKVIKADVQQNAVHLLRDPSEIKESIFAFFFLLISLYFWRIYGSARAGATPTE